jgi:hypothetical protein
MKRFKIIYSVVIVVLYFVFGTLLIFKYSIWQEVPNLSLMAFGGVVIIYGGFRAYRTYRSYQETKNNVDDEQS